MDLNHQKLAQVIVNYSTEVKNGELVRIIGDAKTASFADALVQQVTKAGGIPFVQLYSDYANDIFLQDASEEQLSYENPIKMSIAQNIDVSIAIWADSNTKAETTVDPNRSRLIAGSNKSWRKLFFDRAAAHERPNDPAFKHLKPLRWVGVQIPNDAHAQDAEVSLRQYEKFVYQAGNIHKENPIQIWKDIDKKQKLIVDYLTGKKSINIVSDNGTNITVDVEGMDWISCAGKCNFPDGEVFTGPNLKKGGINGHIKYSFASVYNGVEVDGVQFDIEKGKVIRHHATKGLDFLTKTLNSDEGSRFIGEFAFGTNYNIKTGTKSILFDEKIGGTFHTAIGSGYPETGNCNESSVHWDLVSDLRIGSKVYCDGLLIQENGVWVNQEWR